VGLDFSGHIEMHSNTIFGFLVLAFVVHVTAQGKLPVYMGFLVGPVQKATAVDTKGPGAGTPSGNIAFPGLAPGVSTVSSGFLSGAAGIGQFFTGATGWFGGK